MTSSINNFNSYNLSRPLIPSPPVAPQPSPTAQSSASFNNFGPLIASAITSIVTQLCSLFKNCDQNSENSNNCEQKNGNYKNNEGLNLNEYEESFNVNDNLT